MFTPLMGMCDVFMQTEANLVKDFFGKLLFKSSCSTSSLLPNSNSFIFHMWSNIWYQVTITDSLTHNMCSVRCEAIEWFYL